MKKATSWTEESSMIARPLSLLPLREARWVWDPMPMVLQRASIATNPMETVVTG